MSDGRTGIGPGGQPEGDEALAGEYVLGVLPEAERRRVEARLSTDPRFAALVADWQAQLSALDAHYDPQNVPPAVLGKIETRLFGATVGERGTGLWGSLAFWRGLALASLLVIAGLGAVATGVLPARQPQLAADAPLVADLVGENAPIALLARFDPQAGTLDIVPAAAGTEQPKSLELWAVPGDGVPRSLGLVPPNGGTISVDRSLIDMLGEGVTLAISLEPEGGSPTGVATGPILVAGPLVRR